MYVVLLCINNAQSSQKGAHIARLTLLEFKEEVFSVHSMINITEDRRRILS